MQQLSFEVAERSGATRAAVVEVQRLTIAGWAGRDQAAIEHHIAELAELGVKRPSTTPCFYRLGCELLTQAPQIDVVGTKSSGEAECVLLQSDAGLLVTVGSDHTDREVEAYGVTVSKQVCPKPVARNAWLFDDVREHWDRLELRAFAVANGERRVYQQGSVASLLSAADLLARAPLTAGAAMFCGTLAVQGGIVGMADGDALELELHDPVLQRTLRHAYRVRALSIVE
ncbi:DUF2848 domain-containing protein [bacterium M00.F.Ca.ET.228.01.1.1]|uniref:DUF2848 domain-containing protein n=1 Tax=Paraburkholderia phenoliruptrix TaxID=252970 RepID=UPI001091FA58|nr:DUF2848 domain-containing protein [Paraburkholderia phenoliruptrix]TGP43870.1 DUF2848 domain-containing protein [bacterium M00.F.Ca.ET.228.01.1.1]TGS01533.1 DUF2848 domain-containing protein [bacterium M00.F.Ca.ET.191.01.1.1]TGU08861.1 DUF2848 domain-containing protein [bacterium M00.F.Ca.ET.155.01.1.1]MBW0451274.1 DUF2848 domain-containing protein [Paraburkholderia phenoliruptrix]MBW9097495.1 DUF2848 domain-containing protein [Paraburkholderia phenoliruptrix]